MFNEKTKRDYIEYSFDRNDNLEPLMLVLFGNLEKYEQSLDKDCCNFSADEIIGFYKYLCTPSLERLENINSQLKYYTSYCLSRNLVKDGANHYMELNREILLSCVNVEFAKKKIVSRSELLDVVKDLDNPVDKVLILGLFEGIDGDAYRDFVDMRTINIDEKNSSISLSSNRKLSVSERLMSYMKESAETYEYYALNVVETSNKRPTYSLIDPYTAEDGKPIFKARSTGHSNGIVTTDLIQRRMIVLKRYLGADFVTKKALQASGRIDFIKHLISERNMSLEQAVRDPDLNKRYTRIASLPRFLEKYGSYFEEG